MENNTLNLAINYELAERLERYVNSHPQRKQKDVIEDALRVYLAIQEAVDEETGINGEPYKAKIHIVPVKPAPENKGKAAILMY